MFWFGWEPDGPNNPPAGHCTQQLSYTCKTDSDCDAENPEWLRKRIEHVHVCFIYIGYIYDDHIQPNTTYFIPYRIHLLQAKKRTTNWFFQERLLRVHDHATLSPTYCWHNSLGTTVEHPGKFKRGLLRLRTYLGRPQALWRISTLHRQGSLGPGKPGGTFLCRDPSCVSLQLQALQPAPWKIYVTFLLELRQSWCRVDLWHYVSCERRLKPGWKRLTMISTFRSERDVIETVSHSYYGNLGERWRKAPPRSQKPNVDRSFARLTSSAWVAEIWSLLQCCSGQWRLLFPEPA